MKKQKTVIYCYSHAFMAWRRRLDGIYRYAREAGWFVIALDALDVRKSPRSVLSFWNADGFIVEDGVFCECGLKMADFDRETAVYCGREQCDGVWRVIHDSNEVALCAVRELLLLDLKSYAYVGFRIPTAWSRFREKVFRREEFIKSESEKMVKDYLLGCLKTQRTSIPVEEIGHQSKVLIDNCYKSFLDADFNTRLTQILLVIEQK
jgi:hypothetical protein